MKNFIIWIAVILVSVFATRYYIDLGTVSRKEFSDFKAEVERRFDSVDADLDTLKRNGDTLKIGQRIIFDEVVKENQMSFSERIWKLFN